MVELCTPLVEILQITVTEVAGPLPVPLPVSCPSPYLSPFSATKSQPMHLSGSVSPSFSFKFPTASFSFLSFSLYPRPRPLRVSPAGSTHPDGDTPHTVSLPSAPQIQALRGCLGTSSLSGPQFPTASGCSHCSSRGDSPLKRDTSLPTVMQPCAGVHLSETTSKTNLWPGVSKPF